jgi:hypothetical protein
MASSTGTSLKVLLPSRSPGHLVVLSASGFYSAGGLSGTLLPSMPPGYQQLYGWTDGDGWEVLAWKQIKLVASGEPDPVITLPPGMPTTGWSLRGHADTYSNVDYHDPGWLAVPGTAGNYATVTRTALPAATSLTVAVRASFATLGVANWAFGWANGDVGVGLDAANKLVIYATNTVAAVIGNAASTITVPNITVNQRLWFLADLVTATATCSYFYSLDDVEHFSSVRTWNELGAPVVGTGAGTTMRMSNSGTAFVGARDAATTPTAKSVFSLYEATNVAVYNNWTLSDPDPAGFARVGILSLHRPTTGISSPIEDFNLDPTPVAVPSTDARNVYGPDRLVVNVFTGTSPVKVKAGDLVVGPAGWTAYPNRAMTATGLWAKDLTRSIVAQANVAATPITSTTGGYSYGFYGYTIRPLPAVAVLSSPQPPRLKLGCPDTYTTWITDGTYRRPIELLRWSQITWERVLDSISTASVTIPDEYGGVNCLARAGGLKPWLYGLLIERNDQPVWSGPIVNVGRKGDAIVVAASDVFARYQKRFLIRDAVVDYTNVDVGTMFADIVTTHASSTLDLWDLPVPVIATNVSLTRSLKPREFKYAWDLMSELLNSSIDAYIMNGVLYMWEPGGGWRFQSGYKQTLEGAYNPDFELTYGTFTEESFVTRPDWSLDGMGQTNYTVVPAADTGEMGFRTYRFAEMPASQDVYGLLDMVDPDPMQLPEDDTDVEAVKRVAAALAARASTVSALRAFPPITIEGGVLSQQAPVSVDHLRPGSLWKLDVFDSGYGELLSLLRLRRVSVAVSRSAAGVDEKVSPVLEPPGWEGEIN